jgi:hypothetical protein
VLAIVVKVVFILVLIIVARADVTKDTGGRVKFLLIPFLSQDSAGTICTVKDGLEKVLIEEGSVHPCLEHGGRHNETVGFEKGVWRGMGAMGVVW